MGNFFLFQIRFKWLVGSVDWGRGVKASVGEYGRFDWAYLHSSLEGPDAKSGFSGFQKAPRERIYGS